MARKKQSGPIPSYDELIVPTVIALKQLGGSGTVEEINTKIYEIAKLTDEILEIPHGEDGRSEVDYRLAWSKTYLKKFGLLENSSRGIWALSKPDIDISKLDYIEIVKTVRELNKAAIGQNPKTEKEETELIEKEITDEVEHSED